MKNQTNRPHPSLLRESFAEAIRYWEKRRIPYNLVLVVVVVAWFVLTWPHFRAALNVNSFLLLVVLGVVANICYSAAYLVDVPLQFSSFRTAWRRGRRWVWLMGMVLAIIVTNYWIADEIYPYVNQ
ncbi:MAG: hypothetical protein ACE5HO_01670 [bacterium]